MPLMDAAAGRTFHGTLDSAEGRRLSGEPVERRGLLVRSGLTIGAAMLAGASRAYARRLGAQPEYPDWESVRAEFDVDPTCAHFAGFFLASHPRPVREAIERYPARLGRQPGPLLA